MKHDLFNAEQFSPTPKAIAEKMLAKISDGAHNYLEPSAGKGDLAEAIRSRHERGFGGYRTNVDCIEISPELCDVLRGKGFPVVGYDWLTYPGVCYYDAVVMNPPFSEGSRHLLRAWDFMHDGEIVCLLNQETIVNPCNAERQRLAAVVAEHGNSESLGQAFRRGAARGTDAEVAMVYLRKEALDDKIEAWNLDTPERTPDDSTPGSAPDTMLAIRDTLGNMEHYFNEATTHMFKAFQHARKAALYMAANDCGSRSDYEHALGLSLGNINSARSEFSRKHRRDAWTAVFNKMAFHKWLDKKQRDEFFRDIETNSNIPFTADNIKGTLENIFLQRGKLFEMSVANVFDELTRYFKGNTNHTEGWKSNDSYKVNQKLVFPYGCRCDQFGFDLIYNQSAVDIYNDLDRIMCVLEGRDFEKTYGISAALGSTFQAKRYTGQRITPGICESQYFEIRYFKKGTIHLKWKRLDLWEQFNIKAAAGKKWIGEDKS